MDALRFNEWLASFRVRGINSIAMLFALTTVVRALLITLIPLRALEHMGNDPQALSVLYFCVSAAAVAGNLCVPLLIHWLRRRWVFLLGLLLQISAASISFIAPSRSMVVFRTEPLPGPAPAAKMTASALPTALAMSPSASRSQITGSAPACRTSSA